MQLIAKIHDNLAPCYLANDPQRWAVTVCRGGFCLGTGKRFKNGDEVLCDYSITEFVVGEKFRRDRELTSFKVQVDMVVGWLASDTGEWTFPMGRYFFEQIADEARIAAGMPPFKKGQIMTCRTKLVVVE